MCWLVLAGATIANCECMLGCLPSEAVSSNRHSQLPICHLSCAAALQAKECLGLLPDSPAAQEQLAAIRGAEQLQRLGLDLPPLQLQQLQARAAAGDDCVLEEVRGEVAGRWEGWWREQVRGVVAGAAHPPDGFSLLHSSTSGRLGCAGPGERVARGTLVWGAGQAHHGSRPPFVRTARLPHDACGCAFFSNCCVLVCFSLIWNGFACEKTPSRLPSACLRSCLSSTRSLRRRTAAPWASWRRPWASLSSSSRCCCGLPRRRMWQATASGPRACCSCWLGSTTSE